MLLDAGKILLHPKQWQNCGKLSPVPPDELPVKTSPPLGGSLIQNAAMKKTSEKPVIGNILLK